MAIKQEGTKVSHCVGQQLTQTYCHCECATVRKKEALSAAASHPSKPSKQDRHTALLQRQAEKQTDSTEPRQVHCSAFPQRCQTHSGKDCPLCSANQPVNEGKPPQMWCTKRKLQSEKEFCLTGLRESHCQIGSLLSPPASHHHPEKKKNHSPEGVNNCAILKDTLRKVNICFRGSWTFLPPSNLPSLHPQEPHNTPVSPP